MSIRSFCHGLILFLLLTHIAAPLEASQPYGDEREVSLERIVVTNRRAANNLEEAAENIDVVTEDQIRGFPADNEGEALKYVTGIDVSPSQGFGKSTSLSIQGSDSRQVRVMIDGIPLNSQSSGQVDPSEFPVEDIARIEVVKGAASSSWGSALGGVVNIITKDTGKSRIPEGRLVTSFAGFRTKKNVLELSGKEADFGYYGLLSYMESGGKGQHDDTLEKKSFTKLSYDLKELGRLVASFGFSEAEANSGVFPDGSWQAQPYRRLYGKVGWERESDAGKFAVDMKHSRLDLVTRIYGSADDTAPSTRVENHDILYQLSLTSSFRVRGKDSLVAGADFDNDALKSPNYLSKAKSLRLYAPYASYTLKVDPLDIILGLRYDKNSEFGSQVSPSWGGSLSFG